MAIDQVELWHLDQTSRSAINPMYGLCEERVCGCEVGELPPAPKCQIAIAIRRRNFKPARYSFWTYKNAIFCQKPDRTLRRAMLGGGVFA